jgi:ribosomal protein L37AE/L43A
MPVVPNCPVCPRGRGEKVGRYGEEVEWSCDTCDHVWTEVDDTYGNADHEFDFGGGL